MAQDIQVRGQLQLQPMLHQQGIKLLLARFVIHHHAERGVSLHVLPAKVNPVNTPVQQKPASLAQFKLPWWKRFVAKGQLNRRGIELVLFSHRADQRLRICGLNHVLRNRGLPDIDAELEQFAVDAGRTPKVG